MEFCRICKYHRPMGKDIFMCDNEDSEGYGLETSWDDYCEEFEEREEKWNK